MSFRAWRQKQKTNTDGFVIPTLVAFMLAATIFIGALLMFVNSNRTIYKSNQESQEAINIAEAGINYYLWHLSHDPSDYRDGGTTPASPDPTLGYGPYTHNFVNDNGEIDGTYTLWIKPQSASSTAVTVRSEGKAAKSDIKRIIQAEIGRPSFSSYGVVSDSFLWFGNTETATGPVHSNQGIRMDGANTADVTSARSTYTPSAAYGGDGSSKPGVWCDTSVSSPVNCATRSKTDWRYPVPAVDFNQVLGDMCSIKKTAFSSDAATQSLASLSNACTQTPTTRTAAYIPQRSSTFSATRGYEIDLNSNGTYDIYNVNSETDTLYPYTSALGRTTLASGIPVPTSGVIFVEDNVWVKTTSTFAGRVTIASARLATSSTTNIKIIDDMVYSSKSGTDAIGLVSEGSVTIAPYAPPSSGSFTFEVDAALIAQSGDVKYPSTYSSTSSCTRGWKNTDQIFNFYGTVATRNSWTWLTIVSVSACGNAVYVPAEGAYISGFYYSNTQYDYNLLYSPPPSFPTTSTFNVLSWREVMTSP